jgi:dephospho-CoA kinase
MKYTVALTGGIGSGKSTVADAFSRVGITVVDADIIAREVVEPGQIALERIYQHFGPEILLPEGGLNRRVLRERVFSFPEDKRWINALLHPLIHQRTRYLIEQATSPYVLWVIPLLVENNLQDKADRVLVVDVSVECQIERTMQRDNVSRTQAEQILAAQASREQRLAIADDVINNDGSPEVIEQRVNNLHRQYLMLATRAAQQEIE